ncbi:hypothetical protein EsDP_00002580 [Epichloe bromicola]|uniref:Major facilitator superfamily (MFS) profile domain-containing protein n=1 Tax=Epichloe bromicola TaxID=79588 RepID=A0ABQ0CL81_9HYPO
MAHDPGRRSAESADFAIDDSDEEAVEDYELRSDVGGPETYEMRRRADGRADGRLSVSTVASFQLYTPDEEAAVKRKFDRKLVLFLALLFMLSFLDRSNIGNARIAGMDQDLQTTPPRPDWYEWSLTAFYMSYIAFEWMSLLYRLVPAHVVVSLAVLTWGLAASLQAVAPSYPVLMALRVLLGVGEAGIAGIPFYLSFFFRREELAFRIAIFVSAAPLATSFASTLAYVIVRVADALSSPIAPWRLLFLIEGLPSVLASVVAWSAIPDGPGSARYLTRREKKVAVLRLRSSSSSSPNDDEHHHHHHHHHHRHLRPRELLAVLIDPVACTTSAMLFLTNMAYSSLPVFLPTIMTDMGHDALTSQALSAPPYLCAFVAVLFTAHMSDRLRARTVPIVIHALSSSAGYAVLALARPLGLPNLVRYAAVYPAAVGFFNVATLVIAWTINNQASPARQGAGFAILQFVGQCGPLVGTRLYPEGDAPYYARGMTACAAAMLTVAALALALRTYLRRRNGTMDEADSEPTGEGGAVVDEEQGLVGEGTTARRKTGLAQSFRYML